MQSITLRNVPFKDNITLTDYVILPGKDTDTIQIKSMSLSPDPIVIPGSVNVSIDASIAKDIVSPTSLVLVVKKKLFGIFVKVPCVDNVGSW